MHKKLIYTFACLFTLLSLTTHAGDYKKINDDNQSNSCSGAFDCIWDTWKKGLDSLASSIESTIGEVEKSIAPSTDRKPEKFVGGYQKPEIISDEGYKTTPLNSTSYQIPKGVQVINASRIAQRRNRYGMSRVPQLRTDRLASDKLGVGPVHVLAALNESELSRIVAAVKASQYWPANDNALLERVSVENASLNDVGPDSLPKSRIATVALYLPDTDTFYELRCTMTGAQTHIVGTVMPKARPSWSNTDNNIAIEAVFANQNVRTALKKRGITDEQMDNGQVQYYTLNDGRINDNGNPNVKKGMPDLDPKNGPRPRSMWGYFFLLPQPPGDDALYGNLFVYPVPGVFAWLDLNKKGNPEDKVLLVHDTGELSPMPSTEDLMNFTKAPNYYFQQKTNDLKPILMSMPEGKSWELNNGWLTWNRWKFFITIDPVIGVRLHYIQVDKRADRSIGSPDWYRLFDQMNMQEAITAYSGNKYGKPNQNYFDFAEYNYARFGSPMSKKIDATSFAATYDANFVDETGTPLTIHDAVLISEEPKNTAAFGHYEWNTATLQGGPNRVLKVSYRTTVGNYDYVITYAFDMNGEIHITATASGMDEMSAAHRPDNYSRMLYPNISGALHWHTFGAHLVPYLGGRGNRFYRKQMVQIDSIYGNTWEMQKKQLSYPKDCLEPLEPRLSRHWEVCDHHGEKLLDLPMSIAIEIDHSIERGNKDWTRIAQKTKEFTKYPIIATKYRPNANSYAGKYPVEKPVADGIDIYNQDGGNFDMQRMSIWANMGFHHEPNSGNFPILPAEEFGIHIKPENIFRYTPSLGQK